MLWSDVFAVPLANLKCVWSQHCLPPNLTDTERVMINCRYSPRIQTDDVKVPAGGAAGAPTGTSSGEANVGEFMGPRDPMPRSIFDRLPEVAKPLYSHGLLEE